MTKKINLNEKRFEKELSKIGAKIATATNYTEQATVLTEKTQKLLQSVQGDISELYLSLDLLSKE